MKKSKFLTFICALVPGAGQMYLGLLHRGVSIMGVFFLAVALTSLMSLLGLALPVIWAFAFFDTFTQASRIADGEMPEDVSPFQDAGALGSLLEKRHNLIGGALIFLGAYTLLDRFVLGNLRELFGRLEWYWMLHIVNSIPTLFAALLLVALGLWLIRFRSDPEPPHGESQDFQPYTPPKADIPELVIPKEPEERTEEGPEESNQKEAPHD